VQRKGEHYMTMPISLVLVRHGESESNFAKSRFEAGEPCPGEEGLMQVHTSERRLTPLGIAQAKACGEWLRANWYNPSESAPYRFYVSPYVRAIETAGNIGIGDEWQVDARLMERNWGSFDQMPYADRLKLFQEQLVRRKDHAFFWRPTEGETLQDVFIRLRDMTGSLHRDCSNRKVCVVSHGETMWVWSTVLERLLPMDLREQMLSHDNRIRILNCRIIEYTRVCADRSLSPRLARVRFVNPADPDDPETNSGWREIERKKWSHEDLMAFAQTFPTFLSATLDELEPA